MTPSVYQASKGLFTEAIERPPSERASWLREQNATYEVKIEVARLLGLHAQAGESFLEAEAGEIRVLIYGPAGAVKFEAPQVLNGRYRIVRLLGSGGMGVVYEAFDEHLGCPLAIKFLEAESGAAPESVERFRREVLLARQVSHSNVCRIYEFGHYANECGIFHFLTMELLNGETLRERMRNSAFRSAGEVLALLHQILEGIEAVHSRGIVHRDLKPSNIMVENAPDGPRFVLMDFGLATRNNQSTLTETGKVLGTLDYMAPEQLQGAQLGPWTDLYALGLILFEILTGEKPFAANSNVETVVRRLKENPRLPRSTSAQDLPGPLVNAIHACLERDTKRRPASTAQVRKLLQGRPTARQIQTRRVWMIGTAGPVIGAFAYYRWWPRARAWDPEAVRATKRGEEFARHRTADDLRKAIQEFESATKKEPDFGPAWTGLADTWSALSNFGFAQPRESLDKARDAARRAVALQPSSAKALGALAYVISIDVRHWREAGPYFERAVQLDPKDPTVRLWYGAHLGRLGRFGDALNQLRTGLDGDPSSFTINQQIAQTYLYLRDKEKHLAQSRELVRLQPREPVAYLTLGYALEQVDDIAGAWKAWQEAKRLDPGEQSSLLKLQGVLLERDGNRAAAMRIVAELGGESSGLASLVFLYGRLGLYDEALTAIDRAFEHGDSSVLTLAVNPRFDSVKNLSGFDRLLRQLD